MNTFFLQIAPQLSLHHPNPALAQTIFDLIDQQRDYLQQWLPWVDKTISVTDTLKFLKEARAFNRYGQNFTTFIFHDSEILGSIAFNRFDKVNHSAEIGYWLRKEYQGQGIITKACAALVQYGFEELKLNRIEIKIVDANKKSLAIPKRLGFHHEGCFRKAILRNKTFHDLHVFSKLRSDAS